MLIKIDGNTINSELIASVSKPYLRKNPGIEEDKFCFYISFGGHMDSDISVISKSEEEISDIYAGVVASMMVGKELKTLR